MTVEAIILAAGLSTRMKQFKLAMPLGGHTVIERTVQSATLFCTKIFVICGQQMALIEELLKEHPKTHCIYNELFQTGMFSSVQKGAQLITADYFFVLPGDCPLIRQQTFMALLTYAKTHPLERIIVPTYGGKRGHPILLKRELQDTIALAPQESTLRQVLRTASSVQVTVSDPGILQDLDTQEDYIRARTQDFNLN